MAPGKAHAHIVVVLAAVGSQLTNFFVRQILERLAIVEEGVLLGRCIRHLESLQRVYVVADKAHGWLRSFKITPVDAHHELCVRVTALELVSWLRLCLGPVPHANLAGVDALHFSQAFRL